MNNKKRILTLISIVFVFISIIVYVENSHSASHAVCGGMGSYMGRTTLSNRDFDKVIKPTILHRKWTVEELFSKSTEFTSYNGEGAGTWFYDSKIDRGLDRSKSKGYESAWNAPGVQANLESARGLGCFFGRGDIVPNMLLKLSGSIVGIVNFAMNSLIGDDFMVDTIVDIVGGGGDAAGGLIGSLFHSIYMPLIVIAFLFTAVTIIHKGLIKRQFRDALSSIIWSVGAFIIGVVFMLNPTMLAGLPQTITTTITTCVMGAISGQNCLTGDVTTPGLLAGVECQSEVLGGNNDIETAMNSMNCTIWKAFVLEPWAEEQFGESYSNLYTYNIPSGGSEWSNLPAGKGKDYCVNLASTRSARESKRDGLNMNLDRNSTVCNVALYQLYLKTNMKDPINHDGDEYVLTNPVPPSKGKPYDARWFDIIVPMATDNVRWEGWSGQSQFLSRLGSSFLALISTILATVILFMLTIFGAAYKIVGVIMMAFAPLFLLLAVEPNRGRKIFLGWLETVIATLLKYFAITLLIVVALSLYAGVLSSTSGMQSFLAVLILTSALWMYRKEVVDLIGASNLGGQRLSNKAQGVLDGAKKQAKTLGSAYVGGRLGGAIGASKFHENAIAERRGNIAHLQKQLQSATSNEEEEQIQKQIDSEEEAINELGFSYDATKAGAKQGSRDAMMRTMKRGTSMTSDVFRQMDDTERRLQKDDKENERIRQAKLEKENEIERQKEERQEEENVESQNQNDIIGTENDDSSRETDDSLEEIAVTLNDDATLATPSSMDKFSEEEKEVLNNYVAKVYSDMIRDYSLENISDDSKNKLVMSIYKQIGVDIETEEVYELVSIYDKQLKESSNVTPQTNELPKFDTQLTTPQNGDSTETKHTEEPEIRTPQTNELPEFDTQLPQTNESSETRETKQQKETKTKVTRTNHTEEPEIRTPQTNELPEFDTQLTTPQNGDSTETKHTEEPEIRTPQTNESSEARETKQQKKAETKVTRTNELPELPELPGQKSTSSQSNKSSETKQAKQTKETKQAKQTKVVKPESTVNDTNKLPNKSELSKQEEHGITTNQKSDISGKPSMPSIPDEPSMPSIPDEPSMPSMPDGPSMPSEPSLPNLDDLSDTDNQLPDWDDNN